MSAARRSGCPHSGRLAACYMYSVCICSMWTMLLATWSCDTNLCTYVVRSDVENLKWSKLVLLSGGSRVVSAVSAETPFVSLLSTSRKFTEDE